MHFMARMARAVLALLAILGVAHGEIVCQKAKGEICDISTLGPFLMSSGSFYKLYRGRRKGTSPTSVLPLEVEQKTLMKYGQQVCDFSIPRINEKIPLGMDRMASRKLDLDVSKGAELMTMFLLDFTSFPLISELQIMLRYAEDVCNEKKMGDMAKMAAFATVKEFETVLDGLQNDARLKAGVDGLRKKGAEHTRLNKAAGLQFNDNGLIIKEAGCKVQTSCMDCTGLDGCGWCQNINFPSESKCMPGGLLEPEAPFSCPSMSNSSALMYQYKFCVQEKCSEYTGCRDCNRAPACGWCDQGPGRGKCVDGSKKGPTTSTCTMPAKWTSGQADICPGDGLVPCSRAIQWNMFRGGKVLDNFFLAKRDPQLCAVKCYQNKNCSAWSYEYKAGRPYCWLRSEAVLPSKETMHSATGLRSKCYVGDATFMDEAPEFVSCNKGSTPDASLVGTDAVPFDVIPLDNANQQWCAMECAARSDCAGWSFDILSPRNKYEHPFVDKYTAKGIAADLPWAPETDPLILFSPAANSRAVVLNDQGIPFSLPVKNAFRAAMKNDAYFTPSELGLALSKMPYEQELFALGKLLPQTVSSTSVQVNMTKWSYYVGIENDILAGIGNGTLCQNGTIQNGSNCSNSSDSEGIGAVNLSQPVWNPVDLNKVRPYFHRDGKVLVNLGQQIDYPAQDYGPTFTDPSTKRRRGYDVSTNKCKLACDVTDKCMSFRYETTEDPCMGIGFPKTPQTSNTNDDSSSSTGGAAPKKTGLLGRLAAAAAAKVAAAAAKLKAKVHRRLLAVDDADDKADDKSNCRACYLHAAHPSGIFEVTPALDGLESWFIKEKNQNNSAAPLLMLPKMNLEDWRVTLRKDWDRIAEHFIRFGNLLARPTKRMNRYGNESARDVISSFPTHKASCSFYGDKRDVKGKGVSRKGSAYALKMPDCEAEMPKRNSTDCKHGAKLSKQDLVTCTTDCPMPWIGADCNVCGLRLIDCETDTPNHFKYITDDCKCASACMDNSTCPTNPKNPMVGSHKNFNTCGCDPSCSMVESQCARKSKHHLARVDLTTCNCVPYCILNASTCPKIVGEGREFNFNEETCKCDEICGEPYVGFDSPTTYFPAGKNVTGRYCGMRKAFTDGFSAWASVEDKRANINKLGLKKYEFIYLLKDTEAHNDRTIMGNTMQGQVWDLPTADEPEDANNVPIGGVVLGFDPKAPNDGKFEFSTEGYAPGSYAMRWMHEAPVRSNKGVYTKKTTVLSEVHFTIGEENCLEPVKVASPIVNRKNKDPIKVYFCGATGFKPSSQKNKRVKGDFCAVYLASIPIKVGVGRAGSSAIHYMVDGATKGEFTLPTDKITMPGNYEVRCFNSGQKESGKARGIAAFTVIGEEAKNPRSSWSQNGAPQTPDANMPDAGLGAGMSQDQAAEVNNQAPKEQVTVPGSASRNEMTIGIDKGTAGNVKEDLVSAASAAADAVIVSGKSQDTAQSQATAKVAELQQAVAAPVDQDVQVGGGKAAVAGPVQPIAPTGVTGSAKDPAAQAVITQVSTAQAQAKPASL